MVKKLAHLTTTSLAGNMEGRRLYLTIMTLFLLLIIVMARERKCTKLLKDSVVSQFKREPTLKCIHKEVQACHYTFVTQFRPNVEEVCDEIFEKTCQITFIKQSVIEPTQKCYRPLTKICNGQGPKMCHTVYETTCSTYYRNDSVKSNTECDRKPIEMCGQGCVIKEGKEECHFSKIANLVDVPEENCDLQPIKTCKFKTTMVPTLLPRTVCKLVPKEVCFMSLGNFHADTKPLISEWCTEEESDERQDNTINFENNVKNLKSTEKNVSKNTIIDEKDIKPILLKNDKPDFTEVTNEVVIEDSHDQNVRSIDYKKDKKKVINNDIMDEVIKKPLNNHFKAIKKPNLNAFILTPSQLGDESLLSLTDLSQNNFEVQSFANFVDVSHFEEKKKLL